MALLTDRSYAVESGGSGSVELNDDELAVAVDKDSLIDLVGGDLSVLNMGDLTPEQIFAKMDTDHDGFISVRTSQ